MTAPAGIFCAHKRLRTACPECRPPPPPPPAPKAPKAPASSSTPRSAGAPGGQGGDADEGAEHEAPARRGPGKPLLPSRAKRVKPPTRAEAEKAEAWWVKDR